MAVTPDNAQVYVSTLVDGKVYVLDRVTHASIDSIRTGGSARYIGFDGPGDTAVIPNEEGWVTFVTSLRATRCASGVPREPHTVAAQIERQLLH